ncbi:MAG: glycosyltransferase family 4 protein [Spirochaetales bacterium]|nr:glycosyltransferase family 4 protein [Spirochaetales bacterium]
MKSKSVCIVYNTMWYINNFRKNLILQLIKNGYTVSAVAPYDGYEKKLQEIGVTTYNILMQGNSANPLKDMILFIKLFLRLKNLKPGCVLNYTIKPNIYGSIVCTLLGIPYINNITGLGAVFLNNGILTQIVYLLYRIAFARSSMVFFQNETDREQLLKRRLVNKQHTHRLPGSGVSLEQFSPAHKITGSPFTFLLFTRILWEKGIKEYYEASRMIKPDYPKTVFQLIGPIDPNNPACIPAAIIQEWNNSGFISYLGPTDNIREFIAEADCIVLPSYYREGVPRSMLESAAMAKPIITTDWPGCRDAVDDGITGFLCEVRSAEDLADKMKKILLMTSEQRRTMGLKGRKKMEKEYDEKIVIDAYINIINKIFYHKKH